MNRNDAPQMMPGTTSSSESITPRRYQEMRTTTSFDGALDPQALRARTRT